MIERVQTDDHAAAQKWTGRRQRRIAPWLEAGLGIFPTLVAVVAATVTHTEWIDRLQIPSGFQWVQGVIVLLGLALGFAVVAIAAEIRRANVRRLIDDLEVGETEIDRDLWEFSRSVHQIQEFAAMEPRRAHD